MASAPHLEEARLEQTENTKKLLKTRLMSDSAAKDASSPSGMKTTRLKLEKPEKLPYCLDYKSHFLSIVQSNAGDLADL